MRVRIIRDAAILALLGVMAASHASGKDAGASPSAGSCADLAHQLANPVANLVSEPFQLNYDCCTGFDDDGRRALDIQRSCRSR